MAIATAKDLNDTRNRLLGLAVAVELVGEHDGEGRGETALAGVASAMKRDLEDLADALECGALTIIGRGP